DHAYGTGLGDRAHDWERGQMIATRAQRDRAGLDDSSNTPLDQTQSIHEIDRVDREIADICDLRDRERLGAGDMMHAPHEARLAADLARSVTRAGSVGGAAIPGNAIERDVEALGGRHDRQAHEAGNTGK